MYNIKSYLRRYFLQILVKSRTYCKIIVEVSICLNKIISRNSLITIRNTNRYYIYKNNRPDRFSQLLNVRTVQYLYRPIEIVVFDISYSLASMYNANHNNNKRTYCTIFVRTYRKCIGAYKYRTVRLIILLNTVWSHNFYFLRKPSTQGRCLSRH